MSRFRFRLQRVLRVRAIEEEQARATWLTAEREAVTAEERASERAHGRAAAEAELAGALPALGAADVLLAHRLLDRLAQDAARAREGARTSRFQADAQRAPWEERRAAVRALERWRERALAAHREDERRAEARALEELNDARATRRARDRNHDTRSRPR